MNKKHFLIIKEPTSQRTINLESTTCSIGRDANNLIVIDSPRVSRYHATLLRITISDSDNHLFRIIDGDLKGRRSKNGFKVNGNVCLSYDLKHGDVISFCEDITATYYSTEDIPLSKGAEPSFPLEDDDETDEDNTRFFGDPDDEDDTCFFGNPNNEGRQIRSRQTLNMLEEESQALIQQSLERLASFPELFSDPIVEIDFQGNITYLNPAALRLFPELKKDKLQHSILVGIISLVKSKEQASWMREVKIGEKFFEQSVHYLAASKLIRIYTVDISERKQVEVLLKKAHDELELKIEERTAALKQANDQLRSEIQERQRAEEALHSSMATNRAILNAIPDLIFRINREGIFVNFKAAKIDNLLTPEKKFLGQHIYEIFPQEIALPTMNFIERAFATGEVQILECQIPGQEKDYSYEVRIAVSEVDEVIAIVRDITERKQAEEDIRRTLEQEKKLNELKSRFVTMASHEFRTPLASILSSAELLEHYSHKWSEDKKLNHLHRIQTSVNHMTELLNDVLILGKADAGKLELNPNQINLLQFCQELVKKIQITTQTHNIIFQVKSCLEVYGNSSQQSGTSEDKCSIVYMDEKMLRHILNNLLSNAIKYSPDSNRVIFDLSCQSSQAIFKVQDFGIGIPPSEQDQLFDTFHRAKNVGSIPGTGLGLPIVKRAVDLSGGTITLNSQVGMGTTFTVTLPYLVVET